MTERSDTRRPAPVVVAGALGFVFAACIAGPPGSALPSASAVVTGAAPRSSPTLNPNQVAAQGRSPRPTATSLPTATPLSTARPSPSPYAPDLEALIPAELRGVPLLRWSAPASAFPEGGDMCSIVCPGELPALAKTLGVETSQIDVAVGYADEHDANAPKVVIAAYRVAGVATDRLVEARLTSLQREDMPRMAAEMHVGGKSVTWANYSFLPSPGSMEYLYATGDVLFRIIDGVDLKPGVSVPADTSLAVEGLP